LQNGTNVIQLETACGAGIKNFLNAVGESLRVLQCFSGVAMEFALFCLPFELLQLQSKRTGAATYHQIAKSNRTVLHISNTSLRDKNLKPFFDTLFSLQVWVAL